MKSIETLRILGLEQAAVQGFAPNGCSQGWLKDWEDELNKTIEWLLPLTWGTR